MITIKKDTKKNARREEAELETTFREVTDAANQASAAASKAAGKKGLSKKQKKIIGICAGVVAGVLLLAAGIGTWWFLDYTKDDGRIYNNVYAYGIDLSGMTPEEAAAAIHDVTDGTYAAQNLTVQLPDSTLLLSPAETGASLNVDRLVEMAYNYGRDGSRWENTQARAEALLTSYELDVMSCLTLDQAYIRDVVDQLVEASESTLTQTTVEVTGELPDLERKYEEAIEDTEVQHKAMTITLGTPDRKLDKEALLDAIFTAYETNNYAVIAMDYAVVEPDPIDLEALFTEHCVEPVDAVLDETNFTVTHELLGYGFDKEALTKELEAAEPGQVIEVTFQFLPAEVTKATLDANLFRDTLSSVSSNHTYNPPRTTNLTLAAQAINGAVIMPGGTFSFNNRVGQRTEAKGYKPAGTYVSGSTVDQIGGGICQVASTLYYAAMLADLEIVERTEHQFEALYLPYGMDATIYWGSYDFKFRNNTNYPIRIQASVSGGQVHVKLIGTDEKDYYVKMVYETVSGPNPGGVKYEEYPANNPEGYTDGQVLQDAYTGRTVRTYRCKYSKATGELISSTYEDSSTYAKRDKTVVKIVDDKSTEPTEKPTESTAPSSSETTAPPPTETTAPPTTEATEPPTTQPPETTQPPTTQPPTTEATEPPTTAATETPTEATEPPTEATEPTGVAETEPPAPTDPSAPSESTGE